MIVTKYTIYTGRFRKKLYDVSIMSSIIIFLEPNFFWHIKITYKRRQMGGQILDQAVLAKPASNIVHCNIYTRRIIQLFPKTNKR